MLSRLDSLRDRFYYSFAHYRRYAREIGSDWREVVARLKRFDVDLELARVLDVGCGTFYPYVILFHQVSAFACGIDPMPIRRLGDGVGHESGSAPRWFLRTARSRARDAYFRAAYYGELGRAAGVAIKRWDVNLCLGDAAALPFPDNSFDVVVSRAAFEHISDVQATVTNIARVLRPGGIADITIHLFTSLSGGHEREYWDFRRPRGRFVPWGHLRDPFWRPPMYLNRLGENEYRNAFLAGLQIVSWLTDSVEGLDLVDETVLSALPGHTKDSLSKRMVTVVARKAGA